MLQIPKMTNYLLFQKMRQKSHSLCQHIAPEEKLQTHLPPGDISLIDAELSLLPSLRMGYTKTDLAHTPHGNDQNAIKTFIDSQLREHGIANTTIVHGGSSGSVNLVVQWGISIMYINHPLMKMITNLDAGEICLLRHAVEDHFSLTTYKRRNKDAGRDKFNKRLIFGVGQNQDTSNQKYRRYVLNLT